MDDIRLLILLLPLIFLIHEIEEIFAVEEWSRRYRKRIEPVGREIPWVGWFAQSMNMSPRQFTIAATFEFSLFLLAAVWGATNLFPGVGMYVFTALMAGLVIHVILHAVQAVVLKLYIPGLVSGLVIVLPFCMYLYQRLMQTPLIDWNHIVWTGLMGAGLILPIIILAQVVGHRVGRAMAVLANIVN